MARPRLVKIAALTSAVVLVGSAFAAPAAVAKKKSVKCPGFTSAVEGAGEAETITVTPKATEAKPIVVEFEHAPSLYVVSQEHIYYNVQIAGPSSGLYIREEFDNGSDIDLYLYDSAGEEVASSGAFNPAPVPGVTDANGNGGSGFESIPGHPVSTCEGFTIESSAYATLGTPVTLTLWLGAPAAE